MATPVKIAFATVLVSQSLALILMFRIGHAGLTLSTSIGACFNATLLFWFLRRAGIYTPTPGGALRREAHDRAVRARGRALLALGPSSLWLAATLWEKGRSARRGVRGGCRRLFRRAVAAGFRLADFSRATSRPILRPRRG
jgi:putative peptidoglycan lipid II flippase